MCWKQEWAAAIGNLEHAKEHVVRAQKKLVKRKERNQKNLERLEASKKHNYPSELDRVKALIAKNEYGIMKCERLRGDLEASQDLLYELVTDFGINHAGKSQRLQQLMRTYVPRKERERRWES